jgi:hypothetical protein
VFIVVSFCFPHKNFAMPPKRRSERQNVLAALEAAPEKSDATIDPNVKFVLCDVCDRLITFVVFRSSKTGRDVCNVCRAALEQSSKKVGHGILKIKGASGGCLVFQRDDDIKFLGPAPKYAAKIGALTLSETDDDEVHPNAPGVQDRRLNRQAVVEQIPNRGSKKKGAASANKEEAPNKKKVRQPSKCLAPTTQEDANDDEDSETRPRKQHRVEKSKRHCGADAAPPKSTPKAQPKVSPKVAPRRALLSRQSSPTLQDTGSVEKPTPQPDPSPIEQNRAGVNKPRTRAASAAAASEASKALVFVDEDDMPFFLSQATLSAVAEAASQPITARAPLTSVCKPETTATSKACSQAPPKSGSPTNAAAPTSRDATTPSQVHATVSPPPPNRAEVDALQYVASISSGPVAGLFGGLMSVTSATTPRPMTDRPLLLTFDDDSGFSTSVNEGEAVTWQNSFVGLSRRVIMAAICPAVDEYGVWISFACEGDQMASIDLWHAEATTFGTLEPPKKRFSVALGSGGVIGISWVPVSLAKPDNDALGVCTVLRQKLLLSCRLPRRNVPSKTIHVQIAGAQQIRLDNISTSPVGLQWHTTHHAVAETHLFVIFECSAVAIYQPLAGGPISKKLNLALVATVSPPARRPPSSLSEQAFQRDRMLWYRRSPPFAVGAFNATSNTTSPSPQTVFLAIGDRDALAVMQGPSFELSNFSKHPTAPTAETPTANGLHTIGAVAATTKGFVLATESAIHHYHVRRGEHKQISTAACAAAQIVALREVSSSLLVCANAAGQVVQARIRPSGLELKSVLWLQRGTNTTSGTSTMPNLSLKRAFDGSQQVPSDRASTPVRFAFHPFSLPLFGNTALAYFPDGAWVLFPSSNERK